MYHYALRFEQTEAGVVVFCRVIPQASASKAGDLSTGSDRCQD